MKIAVVHDWFNDIGELEKVVRDVCYPDADVFSLIDFYDDAKKKEYLLVKKNQKPVFLQSIPFSKRFYRFLFPLFPHAIESLNLTEYDLIISSSSSVAKGIQKINLNYIYVIVTVPKRYAWDLRRII